MSELDFSNTNEKIIFETDWLASEPFFYNVRTNKASKNINEIIPVDNNFNFHFEGLYNYLNYGYSVFQQTPIEDIKFMPPSSQLILANDGKLFVKNLPDPTEKWLDFKLKEHEIIELVRERVRNWEKSLPENQKIILPLSGGLDSRFLLWCLKDKNRVRSFTYGISDNQSNSTEVIFAKQISDYYNLSFQQIHLGNFHTYIDDIYNEYGISTHLHSMYHFEFYKKINEIVVGKCALLSGIFGDVFAGQIPKLNIKRPEDLIKLSYSHGLRIDPNKLKIQKKEGGGWEYNNKNELRDQFWIKNSKHMSDYRYQIIFTIRQKMILISYLMSLPRKFGFKTWSPFLDIDIAMSMLNLPSERRINRKWQREFFQKEGLDPESKNLKTDSTNTLDFQATKINPIPPLNINILKIFFDEKYLQCINKNITLTFWSILKYKILNLPKIGKLLRIFGIKEKFTKAYASYFCLKPIEKILNRKNNA